MKKIILALFLLGCETNVCYLVIDNESFDLGPNDLITSDKYDLPCDNFLDCDLDWKAKGGE